MDGRRSASLTAPWAGPDKNLLRIDKTNAGEYGKFALHLLPSGVRHFEDLPVEAREYVRYVERAIGCPISFVSVGAEREAYIRMQ